MKRIIVLLVMITLLSGALSASGAEEKGKSEGPVSISFFTTLNGAGVIKSYDDMLCVQELEKRLNIDIDWVHPTDPVAELGILLASGDYTDVIGTDWKGYSGGIYKAYDDGIVIKLNDLIESQVPNVSALMAENPLYRKAMLNDKGDILGFRRLELGFISRPYSGFQMRKDWLDKLNMDVPETLDDWHKVLRAFKNADLDGNGSTADIPYTGDRGNNFKTFAPAFGVMPQGFTLDPQTGRVIYSPIQDEYKEWIKVMLKWGDEGLISMESLFVDGKIMEQEAVTGTAGAWWHYNSRLERWKNAGRETNPDWLTVAVPYPLGPAGKKYAATDFNMVTAGAHYGISSMNDNIDKTMEMINYLYSAEGSDLFNWGVEGVTYDIKDGKKNILISFDEKPKYMFLDWGFMRIMDLNASLSTYTEHQKTQTAVWEAGSDYGLFIPSSISFTDEESRKIANIYGDIETYTNETVDRILLKAETLEIWDEYVATIEKMGIDQVITIYQNALNRYNAR